MRAAVLHAFHRPLEIEEVERADPGDGEVTIQVKACGMCLTDVHIMEGKIPSIRPPLIPGHEFAGVVVRKGSAAGPIEIGDRVTVNIDTNCGWCDSCLQGLTNRCENLIRIGFERDGGMAEYVNVPARNIEKIDNRVSFEEAAVIPDAVATMYRALKSIGKVTVGTKVAILGIGGLGMQGIKLGKLMGARVVGTSRNEKKLARAKALGADHVINTGQESLLDATRKRIGPYDVVIDNIGTKESIHEAVLACRHGGRVVVVGYVDPTLHAPFYDVVIREKQIFGVRAATRKEFREIVGLVNSGQFAPDIGEIIPLTKVNEAIQELKKGEYLTRNVLQISFS